MSRKCQLTGRGPTVGHKVSHSHKLSKKVWNVNLQKIRVLVDGKVVRMRVSTKAIKSGMIVKPPIRLRKRRAKVARQQAVVAVEEDTFDPESPPGYFSSDSVVGSVFKKKRKASEVIEELDAEDSFATEEGVIIDDTVPIEAYAETIPADPSASPKSMDKDDAPDSTTGTDS